MKKNFLPLLLLLGLAGLPAVVLADVAAPPSAPAPSDGSLRFNFRGAPLETVLNYMSDAAGYIIVLETPVKGTVDMWSTQAVSREEALQLLNLALNKNGYSARVQGRNLVVSAKEEARKQNIPIHTGNNPDAIPQTAEMVMQIIPLSHIDATQAASDLGTLLPSSASLTANKDSNSLIVTDTQINIHHIVEIVAALDTSIDTVSTVRVFRMKNADPTEMAQLLTSLFTTTATGAAQGNNRGGFPGFGGGFPQLFGGGGGGGFPGGGGGGGAFGGGGGGGGGGGRNNRGGGFGSTTSSSGGRSTPVVAVADPRTFSVVVTAAKTQMPEIAEMINQLDTNSGRKQRVYVYTMENADVKQVESILKNLFQTTNSRSTTDTQADPLSTRASNNTQTTAQSPSLSLGTTSTGRNQ